MIQPPGSMDPNGVGVNTNASASSLAASPAGGGVDFVKIKHLVHVIIRRIWIVAICFTLALIASVIITARQQSVYMSATSLLLTRGSQLPSQLQMREQDIFGDFIETQIRIIYSSRVVSRAREMMNMPADEIGRLLVGVRVWPVAKASVVGIGVESYDPQFAADFANAIADAYMEFKTSELVSGSQNTIINLTQQANKIRDELRKAEQLLAEYKRDNLYLVNEGKSQTASTIMKEISTRISSYRLERMVLEYQRPMLSDATDDVVLTALGSRTLLNPLAGAMDNTRGQAEGAVVRSPVELIDYGIMEQGGWQVLKRTKSKLEHDLRIARENLRDSHPTIQGILKELRDVQALIDREVQFATEKYFSDLEALSIKENALSRVEAYWVEEAMSAESVMDRYGSLQGDVDRLRRLYEMVFARIREIDISASSTPDNVTIIERAVARNRPVSERQIQSIFFSALIGLAIGLGIVFGLEFLDDSIRYPEDIGRTLGFDFLGVIPSANWSEGDIRTHMLSQIDPKSGLAEAYRNVRSTLLLADPTRSKKTMLVTSSVPREGKTTTSLNLAICFSQAGLRVLLVDADMRRGEIHKYFGLEGGRGLSDILSGQAKTESLIQRTGIPNLDMVATGPFPSNPAELILRNEFKSFMEYAKRTYDKIVFDGPPVMAVSEASVLASFVDSVVMVVWAGKTSRKLCQMTAQNLQQRGANITGVILNNLEFGRVGYYYYSTYYSYYNYDYRYDEEHRGA